MDENKYKMNRINKRIRYIQYAEVLFIAVSSYFCMPVVPLISVFFLLQLPMKEKAVASAGLIWHIFMLIFCIYKNNEVMIPVSLPLIGFYIAALNCARENAILKTQPGYPYFIDAIETARSRRDQYKRISPSKENNIAVDDKKHASAILGKIKIKVPENVREYTIVLSLIILVLGGLNLHCANFIICIIEAFMLSSALILNNINMLRVGIIAHIAAVALLLLTGTADSNVFIYILLILIYCLQTFLYYKSYLLRKKEIHFESELVKYEKEHADSDTFTVNCSSEDASMPPADQPDVNADINLINELPEGTVTPIPANSLRYVRTSQEGMQMDSISIGDISHDCQ